MKIIIKPKKITRKNFKKFGDLISTKKIKPININNKLTPSVIKIDVDWSIKFSSSIFSLSELPDRF